MSRTAFLLFSVVLITHYAYPLLASFYPDPAVAARAWFYVLRGAEGFLLFLVVMALLPRDVKSLPLVAICAWGALEEGETSVCRLSLGMGVRPEVGLWQGLCDLVTGWPVYILTLWIVAWVLIYHARTKK